MVSSITLYYGNKEDNDAQKEYAEQMARVCNHPGVLDRVDLRTVDIEGYNLWADPRRQTPHGRCACADCQNPATIKTGARRRRKQW